MTLYKRNELPKLLAELETGKRFPAFLLFGDRFLCQQAADKICEVLLAGGPTTVNTIDGEQEDIGQIINRLRSYSLLPGIQVYRITDCNLFHSKNVADRLWKRACAAHEKQDDKLAARYLRAMLATADLDDADLAEMSSQQWKKHFSFSRPGTDLQWTAALLRNNETPRPQPGRSQGGGSDDQLLAALEGSIPADNLLLLLAEEVDKRKRLFKWLKQYGTVIDLSVDKGSGSRAQRAQKDVLADLVRQSLDKVGKSMAAATADVLFERVGFHPVAVVMETEKLACYVGNRREITRDDLDAVVGRSRQEALFELTGAIGARQLEASLRLSGRLLEHGIHPLAVLATLRNYVRSLLLFRSLQEQPDSGYRPGISSRQFQQQCLAVLKQKDRWKDELAGHPYGIYMQFRTASTFTLNTLHNWLTLILETEFRLKGSFFPAEALLQQLIVSMLLPCSDNGPLQK